MRPASAARECRSLQARRAVHGTPPCTERGLGFLIYISDRSSDPDADLNPSDRSDRSRVSSDGLPPGRLAGSRSGVGRRATGYGRTGTSTCFKDHALLPHSDSRGRGAGLVYSEG